MPPTKRAESSKEVIESEIGRATGKGWVRVRQKPALISPLVQVPSPLDLEEYLGDSASRIIDKDTVHEYARRTLTADEFHDALGKYQVRETVDFGDVRSVLSNLKNKITGKTMLKTLGTETSLIPIGELHRPQVQGCKSTFSVTYTSKTDVSVTVTVFGVGGGTTLSRSYSWGDSTEASGECLRLSLPTTIKYELWQRRDRTTFTRGLVTDVAEDYQIAPLPASEDACGLPIAKARGFPGKKWDFGTIPANTTQTKPVDATQEATLTVTVQPTIAGITIGPQVKVQFSRELKYSFLLAGPRDYVGYSPKGWPQVCFAWSP